MSYSRKIWKYGIVFIVYMVLWYWVERDFILYESPNFELLYLIVGTHGGYGYFLWISSVFLLVYLFITGKEVNPFSINLLSRVYRKKGMRVLTYNMAKIALAYAFVYIFVQIINVTIVIGFERLLEFNFYPVMGLYFVAITNVFLFGGMLFLLLYIITRNNYLSMIITVCINMVISYYGKTDILYGGLSVIDNMTMGTTTNIFTWTIWQMINVCVIIGIYFVTEEIYRKKDIV